MPSHYGKIINKLKIIKEYQQNADLFETCLDEKVENQSWESLFFPDAVNEEELIDEANVVTFNKKAYPKEGWAVILAGGAGSGKGFTLSKMVLIDAKILDVDHLKKMYNLMSGSKYNLRNPDHVAKLHQEIDAKGWKEEILKMFFTANNRLTNIVFDITGKNLTSMQNYSGMVKDLGYNLSVVWVITNREVALVRNLLRDRIVPQQHFHQIHNQVNDTMFAFLEDPWFSKRVDEAWVVFSGPAVAEIEKHGSTSVRDEKLKNKVFKLIRKGNVFTTMTLDKGKLTDLKSRIIDWLGPKEVDYQEPVIYKTYDQIQKDIGGLKKDKEGKIVPGQKLDLKQQDAW